MKALQIPTDALHASAPPAMQTDAAARDDPMEDVGGAISRRIGNQQAMVVKHPHEPGRPSARRDVGEPMGVSRRQGDERCCCDEGAAIRIKVVDRDEMITISRGQ